MALEHDIKLQKLAAANTLMVEIIAAPSAKEVLFLFTNFLTNILPIELVVTTMGAGDKTEILTISGQENPPSGGDFADWLKAQADFIEAEKCCNIAADSTKPNWLPSEMFALTDKKNGLRVFIFGVEPLDQKDTALARRLFTSTAQLYIKARGKTFKSRFNSLGQRHRVLLAGLIAMGLLVPVRQTVSAPAEIVAREPYFVRSEILGTLDTLLVTPNTLVKKDQPIARLDDQELKADLAIAAREVALAEAEYDQLLRQALTDQQARAELSVKQLNIDLERAKLKQVRDRLDRVTIASPSDGIIIIDNDSELIGKPLQAGETIARIGDPKNVQVQILLPLSDAIELQNGNLVKLFLNTAPNQSFNARLSYASYQAAPSREGYSVFRLEADFDEESLSPNDIPRLGLRGTAVLYGNPMPLIFQLIRKPVASLRQWMGL